MNRTIRQILETDEILHEPREHPQIQDSAGRDVGSPGFPKATDEQRARELEEFESGDADRRGR